MNQNNLIHTLSNVRKTSKAALVTSLFFTLMIAFVPGAFASITPATHEIHDSGTWSFTVTSVLSTYTSGGVTYNSVTFSETLTGTISGTSTGTGLFVIYPDGSAKAYDLGIFTGTVAGSGSGSALRIGKGSANPAGDSSGIIVFSSGSAGLAGIHVFNHWKSNGACSCGTYWGKVEFSS